MPHRFAIIFDHCGLGEVSNWGALLTSGVGALLAWRGHSVLHLVCSLSLCVSLGLATKRGAAALASGVYFLVATWPLVHSTGTFFGERRAAMGWFLWIGSATLLALPFSLLWRSRPAVRGAGIALALALGAVPPLGLLAVASPLTAAGALFPGAGWVGLTAMFFLCVSLAVWPRPLVLAILALCAWNNRTPHPQPLPPSGWAAVNTTFGETSFRTDDLLASAAGAGRLQQTALASRASVLVFPESVIPLWTPATDLFWAATCRRLRTSGKTILIGSEVPIPNTQSIANAVVIRGSETGVYKQRVPVPIGMWGRNVPLHLGGPGTLTIGSHRAAVLICWEQLLVWPVLDSFFDRPDTLLALSNHYWTKETAIPAIQKENVAAWARLFQVPLLTASNE